MSVTIKEIADRLGVSISTISKGLNGAMDISEDLRQKILDTAIEMGYQTKKMRKETNKKLAIFVEHIKYENPEDFGYDIVLGFKQMAGRDKWNVRVIPMSSELQKNDKYDTYMLKNGFSGGFFMGFNLEDEWVEKLPTTTIPTVLLDNPVPRNSNVSLVGTDNKEALEYSLDHLYKLGHRKIAMINGPKGATAAVLRHEAFRFYMEKYGLNDSVDNHVFGHYSAEGIDESLPAFLDKGVTAFICGDDHIATGVIDECIKMGYKVPEDVSVIGFDDLPIAADFHIPVTTIRQDRVELGKSAYVILNSHVKNVSFSKTLMHAKFIERKSTGPCKDK